MHDPKETSSVGDQAARLEAANKKKIEANLSEQPRPTKENTYKGTSATPAGAECRQKQEVPPCNVIKKTCCECGDRMILIDAPDRVRCKKCTDALVETARKAGKLAEAKRLAKRLAKIEADKKAAAEDAAFTKFKADAGITPEETERRTAEANAVIAAKIKAAAKEEGKK